VARGLDTVIERHRGETVVVACHGGVIVHSLVRWLGLGLAAGAQRAWLNPVNTSLTEWRFAENPWVPGGMGLELVRFNDHAHLTGIS
jgi:broad specificity phosphatase PhoE